MAEIGRRLVHASGVGAPLSYLLGVFTWEQLGWVLTVGLAVTLALELVRLRSGLDWWIYENLTREYEQEKIAGYALYMVGMVVVVLAFPPEVGVPAMFMLAIGDPVGGYLGKGAETKSPVALGAVFLICSLHFHSCRSLPPCWVRLRRRPPTAIWSRFVGTLSMIT